MSLGTVLLVVLLIFLLGGLPTWGWHSYGYGLTGGIGVVLVIVLILVLLGRL